LSIDRFIRPPGQSARSLFSRSGLILILLVAVIVLSSCGRRELMTGYVRIDGSSTVFPITEAVAEEFMIANPGIRVSIGVSGTGGGFKKFLNRETDIQNASRTISPGEAREAEERGIEYLELPVAYDGLTVIVNPRNDWVDSLTVEELRAIWEPGSTIQKWSDVRPEWPDIPLRLYGPGTDSGTFDYFTEAIMGEPGASRPDYTASEDDNVLITGVQGDLGGLGYLGYAYYYENRDKVKAVPIDGGSGPVLPTAESINSGRYSPLSRPVLIYVNKESLARPEVAMFVEYYLTTGAEFIPDVGYVQMPPSEYETALQKVREAIEELTE